MIFPIKIKPLNDFTTGIDSFGANRENGARLHSGLDLYCPEGTEVFAMESGKVFNSYPDFYLGAGAVEIIGTKYTIRYAEMKPIVKAGMKIMEGQLIGFVKKCKGISQAMLHLEIYSDTASRLPLTDKRNPPYKRRKDLIDPTNILLESMKNGGV